jgi:hypothetical protein
MQTHRFLYNLAQLIEEYSHDVAITTKGANEKVVFSI